MFTQSVISVTYIAINKKVTEVYNNLSKSEFFLTKPNGFFVSRTTASETLNTKTWASLRSRVFPGLQLLHEQTVFGLEQCCKQCLLALNFNKANINLIKWSRKQAQREGVRIHLQKFSTKFQWIFIAALCKGDNFLWIFFYVNLFHCINVKIEGASFSVNPPWYKSLVISEGHHFIIKSPSFKSNKLVSTY